jgi:hypothetical protein
MLEPLQSYLLEQWRVIANAPIPFIMAVAVSALFIWWAVSWWYGARLEHKNAQIELQDRQLADYK